MILALNALWINLVATQEGVSGPSQRAKTQAFSIEGRTVRTASGRISGVSVAGEVAQLPYEYVVGTAALRDKLRSWQGQLVQIRDKRGQKWYGFFLGVDATEYLRDDLYRISFSLDQLSYTEGS